MLLVVFLLLFQNQIEINEIPLKPESVQLSEYSTITNGEDGFYDDVRAAMSNKGEIVVYDIGNSEVIVFDKDQNIKLRFGKEGNGPGEFRKQNPMKNIYLVHDLFLITNWNTIQVFDKKGKYLQDIKSKKFNMEYTVIEKEFGFRLQYKKRSAFEINEFVYQDFNFKCEQIHVEKRKEYVKISDEKHLELDLNPLKAQQAYFDQPHSMMVYGDGFIHARSGDFKLELLDQDLNVVTILTKKFDRVKMREIELKPPKGYKMSDKRKKAFLAEQQKYVDAQKVVSSGYEYDIFAIEGIIDDYIFLNVADNEYSKKTVNVISPDFKFIDQFEVPLADEIITSKVENGKYIICAKNDDIGPYVKVYDITIN